VYPVTTLGHNAAPATSSKSDAILRQTLDRFLARRDRKALLARDPVQLVHRFRDPGDREVAGLIVAMLAYGRAASIRRAAGEVLDRIGPSPARAVDRGAIEALHGFVYRFQSGSDLVRFLGAIRSARRTHGSLGAAFASVAGSEDTYAEAMGRFVAVLEEGVPGPMSPGLRFLLPSPASGSAAKRLCLYLRWMIRPGDGLDLGVWKGADPSRLVIPLDTHIARIGAFLGLTDRKTRDLKMAVEITRSLARLRPDDPLAYDMALCHLGISGECKGRYVEPVCRACPINGICKLGAQRAPRA
jgi:uncharacterized protein (TIGR02757 family)